MDRGAAADERQESFGNSRQQAMSLGTTLRLIGDNAQSGAALDT
jgi:hypothetical protein